MVESGIIVSQRSTHDKDAKLDNPFVKVSKCHLTGYAP